jgi:hypothetical protein
MVKVYLNRTRVERVEILVEGNDIFEAQKTVQEALDRGASLTSLGNVSKLEIIPEKPSSGWVVYRSSRI